MEPENWNPPIQNRNPSIGDPMANDQNPGAEKLEFHVRVQRFKASGKWYDSMMHISEPLPFIQANPRTAAFPASWVLVDWVRKKYADWLEDGHLLVDALEYGSEYEYTGPILITGDSFLELPKVSEGKHNPEAQACAEEIWKVSGADPEWLQTVSSTIQKFFSVKDNRIHQLEDLLRQGDGAVNPSGRGEMSMQKWDQGLKNWTAKVRLALKSSREPSDG